MSNKDRQKLIDLADAIRKVTSTKTQALDRLVNAGILNKKGHYTKHYPTLATFQKK
ncbi:hypothetical protein [Pedobacter rhizosphaerae]|uniref:Uncharacterized protein n=1 Tax=Pedobacter rhizosphaerae TaxID=390241 RepID=A0A1H9VPE5_9SPHI|nr:hypothetical protein [Pedobacter rhizosphaerae]SES23439.1 hypothetical protein SAMN04488023_14617 [Pedobacter rhizosphaerae]